MAIYIKGMEMPKICAKCPFFTEWRDHGICDLTHIDMFFIEKIISMRHEKCPLIEVPEPSAEQKWIPVSERLPKVGQDVLFCDGKWTEEGYMMEDGDWCQFRWSTFRHKEDVTAWMPLPKPYREDDEV